MTPRTAYEQNRRLGTPRIDMILKVYDGIIERLEKGRHAPAAQARTLLADVRIAVSGLLIAAGQSSEELSRNFQRLYDFVLHCLDEGTARIEDALSVLCTLRESFQAIRAQAVEMERSGIIPPLDREHVVESLV
jgi:flagellar protein FliS